MLHTVLDGALLYETTSVCYVMKRFYVVIQSPLLLSIKCTNETPCVLAKSAQANYILFKFALQLPFNIVLF